MRTYRHPRNFSQRFDLYLCSVAPEITALARAIIEAIGAVVPATMRPTTLAKCVRVVVLNVFAAYETHPKKFVSYSRRSKAYTRSHYQRHDIGRGVIDVINAMHEAGFLEGTKGSHNRANPALSFVSRMRATGRLVELIRQHAVTREMIVISANAPTIILKSRKSPVDGRRQLLVYEPTDRTRRIEAMLDRYNALLRETPITLDAKEYLKYLTGLDIGTPELDFVKKYTYRVFNNGSFDEGGRFYGGWWVQCPRNLRTYIRINGEETCELDFGSMHAVILYTMEGVDYLRSLGDDPYALPGFDRYEDDDRDCMRDVAKSALLVAINSQGKNPANALNSRLRQAPELYAWFKQRGLKARAVIEALRERHPIISKYFFTGIGLRLQNIDAEIAERVLDHFAGKGIAVLGLHDSFIIAHPHVLELDEVMRDTAATVIRERIGIVGEDDWAAMRVKAKGRERDDFINAILKIRNSVRELPENEHFDTEDDLWDDDFPY